MQCRRTWALLESSGHRHRDSWRWRDLPEEQAWWNTDRHSSRVDHDDPIRRIIGARGGAEFLL
jgi:hypothetical protein